MKINDDIGSDKHGSGKETSEGEGRIAGLFDVYIMNLGIILAGVVIGWNTQLYIGIGEYLISLALCSLGYISLALCVAEMAGAVAFSGGSFGYARCTISPFVGYLVGIYDLLQSCICTALFVDVIAKAFNIALNGTDEFLPLWWLAIYVFLIITALLGNRVFWNMVYAVTFLTIILMCMYGFGNISRLDFNKWADKEVPRFAGSPHEFINNLIVPTVCYIGVDLITVFGEQTKEPQKNIPRAMVPAMVTTILFAWWMTVTCVSIMPGVSAEMMSTEILFPLHFGFEQLFNTDHHVAHFMMGLTILSSAFGFMFAASRQMYSMAKSGLLPAFLGKSFGKHKSPLISMIFVAILGFVVLLPVWGINPGADDLYEVCIVGACFVYLGLFWCYLIFQFRFESLERTFVNPFGIWSAIYGIIYFSAVVLSLLFAQLDFNALIAITPYTIIFIIYYFKVVESRQFFSKDEQAKFMKAYILNANRRRKKLPPSKYMKAFMFVFQACGCKKLLTFFAKKNAPAKLPPASPTRPQPSRSKNAPSNASDLKKDSMVPVDTGALISKNNQIAPVEHLPIAEAPIRSSSQDPLDDASHASNQMVSWSGKILNPKESRTFFEIVNNTESELPGIDLAKELPEKFVVVREPSDKTLLTEATTTIKTKEVSSRSPELL